MFRKVKEKQRMSRKSSLFGASRVEKGERVRVDTLLKILQWLLG
jgi:hypothetical protein